MNAEHDPQPRPAHAKYGRLGRLLTPCGIPVGTTILDVLGIAPGAIWTMMFGVVNATYPTLFNNHALLYGQMAVFVLLFALMIVTIWLRFGRKERMRDDLARHGFKSEYEYMTWAAQRKGLHGYAPGS